MKKFLSTFLLPFIFFCLIASPVIMGVSSALDTSPIVATLIVAVLSVALVYFFKAPAHSKNVSVAGVEVEVWANYIIERLWKANAFLQNAFSDDDKVLAGKVVHIPQPGAKPTVTKNRSSYPATAVKRSDNDVTFALDEYTTAPTHIPNADKVELSYDKIDSVYGDHAGQLSEDVAGDALVKWALGLPQTSFVKTTGSTIDATVVGTTGSRKAFTTKDLKKAQLLMNKQNILSEDRYALLSADMHDQLLDSLSETQNRDFSRYMDAEKGIVGKLYGFNIMERSEVLIAAVASGSFTIKPFGATVDATDNDVSLCWQKNAVSRALGEVKFFENPDRAEYYGDVYSALLRFGGRRRRSDNNGVVAIVQETV